jgi:hypothetical protein
MKDSSSRDKEDPVPHFPAKRARAPISQHKSWAQFSILELTEDCWHQLLRNEIPAVVIRGLATADECARLVEVAEVIGFRPYQEVLPQIDRIGTTVFEHRDGSTATYFEEAARLRALQRTIFGRSFSPLERFMNRLAAMLKGPVEVAVDPVQGSYYAGLVRRIENGTLPHIDFAPVEEPGWWVADVEVQLTWNLYLELDPASPGKTHIYNREWMPADDVFKIDGSYGYERAVVSNAEEFVFQPSVGDVYIFNTRNFHEVEPCAGRRITATSAIGVLPDGRTVLWS